MAMAIVATANTIRDGAESEANMWWAHTPQPRKPIAAPKHHERVAEQRLAENTGALDTMPKAGNDDVHLGCPKIEQVLPQQRVLSTEKNVARFRWKRARGHCDAGTANSSRNCTTSTIQVNTGIFMRLMPGARMLRMVTMRLIAPESDAMPAIWRANNQKSTPCVGEKIGPEFGE